MIVILANIYIIRNTCNNKVYVGQTTQTLEQRFHKHIIDSKVIDKAHRPLYQAMQKYGKDNFYIELIEKCNLKDADDREQYWIKFYNSYGNDGYNATIGGQSYKPYYYEDIAKLIENGYSRNQITEIIGCYKDTVSKVARAYNLPLNKVKMNKSIIQYDLNGNQINKFENIASAARYIKDLVHPSGNEHSVRKCISRCCNDKTKSSAYGFLWSFLGDAPKTKKPHNESQFKAVKQIDLKTGEIVQIFESVTEATRFLGKTDTSAICDVCNHKRNRKTAFNYGWEYV